jgi:hypothetical protein
MNFWVRRSDARAVAPRSWQRRLKKARRRKRRCVPGLAGLFKKRRISRRKNDRQGANLRRQKTNMKMTTRTDLDPDDEGKRRMTMRTGLAPDDERKRRMTMIDLGPRGDGRTKRTMRSNILAEGKKALKVFLQIIPSNSVTGLITQRRTTVRFFGR